MWVVEPCNRAWDEYEVNAFQYAKDKFWKDIGGVQTGDEDPDFLPVFLAFGPGRPGKVNAWDFTQAARFWTAGKHANHGFMLHGDSADYMRAHTREAAAVKDRPAVYVIYVPGWYSCRRRPPPRRSGCAPRPMCWPCWRPRPPGFGDPTTDPVARARAVAARGELDNTYIVFTSDNGYHLGQHRFLNGKFQVYEEDIRVPLIVRGPGVEAGAVRHQLAVNIDLAPTMARWGRATADRVMDGQSLAPLLGAGGAGANWRTDFLVELYRHLPPAQNGDVIRALRTEHEVYVEYRSGPRELYDLRTDPFQLQNIYATAGPVHVAALSARLAELVAARGNPPTVESVVVNDGAAQRSMVTSVTVTFDRVVTLDPGAFDLRHGDGGAVGLSVATSVAGGRTIAVVTFTGPGVVAGSLADGTYTLTIRAGHVRDLVGRELDGDGDGNGGGDRAAQFHHLFGDSDGDRDVDLARFLSAVGHRPGAPGYQAYFDVDDDERIGVTDTLALARRLGSRPAP